MRRLRTRWRGYTLAELLIVVALIATLAALGMWATWRSRARNDLSSFARAIVNSITVARRRAVTTNTAYLVDIRAASVSYCQQDAATPAQATCPTANVALESSRPYTAGQGARVAFYAHDTDVGNGPAKTAIGGGTSFLIRPNGTSDSNTATTTPDGFTAYLRNPDDFLQTLLVAVYPLATRPHITDKW